MGDNTSGGTFIELARRRAERAAETGCITQEVDHAGLYRLPGGRKEIQVPQASFAHAIQHDAGAVPREMGIGAGLSDGGAELRSSSVPSRQTNGARSVAASFARVPQIEGPGEVVAGA